MHAAQRLGLSPGASSSSTASILLGFAGRGLAHDAAIAGAMPKSSRARCAGPASRLSTLRTAPAGPAGTPARASPRRRPPASPSPSTREDRLVALPQMLTSEPHDRRSIATSTLAVSAAWGTRTAGHPPRRTGTVARGVTGSGAGPRRPGARRPAATGSGRGQPASPPCGCRRCELPRVRIEQRLERPRGPRRDARKPLEPLEPRDDARGPGSVSGDRGAHQRELERQTRRGRPPHVGLRGQQQRDHARELGGRELPRLGAQALGRVGGTSSRPSWPGAVRTSSRLRKCASDLVGDVAKVLALLHEPVDDLERRRARRRPRRRRRARAGSRPAAAPSKRRDDRVVDRSDRRRPSPGPAARARRGTSPRRGGRSQEAADSDRASTPSSFAIAGGSRERSSIVSRRKSNRWQRPTIVAGILCGSVVARTNRTPSGGSSNTFSSASNASRERRCASSMM